MLQFEGVLSGEAKVSLIIFVVGTDGVEDLSFGSTRSAQRPLGIRTPAPTSEPFRAHEIYLGLKIVARIFLLRCRQIHIDFGLD